MPPESINNQPAGFQGPNPTLITPPPPKRRFPKIPPVFLWVIGGLIILIIIVLVLLRIFRGGVSGEAITWWGLWEDDVVVAPLIEEYKSSHPGVEITYVKQSAQDYRERLTSSLAKGMGPDIFAIHNTWTPMFRGSLDTLPADIINPADFARTFYPVAASDLTLGSGIVGIPLMYDAISLYINEDIFNNAGKSAPTTWDELRVTARELTVKDDQGIITQSGVALGRTENVDHWPEILALMMIQNGVDLSNPIGKPAEDALTFFTIFSTVDGVWDATLPVSTQAFAGGKLAMYIGPSWRAFEISEQNPNLKFRTVPIPQLPKDSPTQPDITYATYWAQGVWSRSASKPLAWDFLKFLSTQDSLEKLYANAARVRGFGEIYPRVDMASLLVGHAVAGSIVSQAGGAQSWYLASRTFDGPTGINSQLINYFADAVNALIEREKTSTQALETVRQGVQQILTQYQLIR